MLASAFIFAVLRLNAGAAPSVIHLVSKVVLDFGFAFLDQLRAKSHLDILNQSFPQGVDVREEQMYA